MLCPRNWNVCYQCVLSHKYEWNYARGNANCKQKKWNTSFYTMQKCKDKRKQKLYQSNNIQIGNIVRRQSIAHMDSKGENKAPTRRIIDVYSSWQKHTAICVGLFLNAPMLNCDVVWTCNIGISFSIEGWSVEQNKKRKIFFCLDKFL